MIWTSHEPISKFGNPDLQFWKFGDRDDTPCQVQGPPVHFTHYTILVRVRGSCKSMQFLIAESVWDKC